MQIRRLLVVAGLLLPAVLAGSSLGAQTEVDRAADELAQATAEQAEAQRLVDAWAARRGSVQDQVMAALFTLEQTNSRLEQVSFEAFDLRKEILETESRVRRLRNLAESRAVEAYMDGTTSGLFSLWSASSFEQSVLLEETAASTRRVQMLELGDLAVARDRLVALQGSFHQNEEGLRILRVEAEKQGSTLQELFDQIDAQYVLSLEDLRQADAGFQRALSEWEAAQRRRAARAGVEPWRSLVEEHFPEQLIEQALRVMSCESGGNPDAVHPASDATGLFQFLAGTWAFSSVNAGFPGASRFDAEANVAAAAWLVDYSIRTGHPGGAWGHWECQP